MEFLPAIAMAALVVKFVDFLRYAWARDVNGVVTQIIVWIAGVATVCLVAQTVWASGILIGTVPLGVLGFWSQVFAGVSVASAASVVKDTLKSVDSSNSAKIPTLLPPGPTERRVSDVG